MEFVDLHSCNSLPQQSASTGKVVISDYRNFSKPKIWKNPKARAFIFTTTEYNSYTSLVHKI